ncbi:hypothetical protein GJAV_G00087070 [Gymnothorax javanicus]|nr:hypothetical protein GJAV_G00087070 [Gymnothorax javanicus]
MLSSTRKENVAKAVRKHREKVLADPQAHEAYLQKERERYKSRKAAGKIKTIHDLPAGDQCQLRKQWLQEKRYQRAQRKAQAAAAQGDPPAQVLYTFELHCDAGRSLRRDTETLPELTEQHRMRLKEEELHGQEFVLMAESETKCATPGVNTLDSDCAAAHYGVSDVHHADTSLIKTETHPSSAHTVVIKTESKDCTDLAHVIHLHPDQIKAETADGDCIKAEQFSDLRDIICVDIHYDESETSIE